VATIGCSRVDGGIHAFLCLATAGAMFCQSIRLTAMAVRDMADERPIQYWEGFSFLGADQTVLGKRVLCLPITTASRVVDWSWLCLRDVVVWMVMKAFQGTVLQVVRQQMRGVRLAKAWRVGIGFLRCGEGGGVVSVRLDLTAGRLRLGAFGGGLRCLRGEVLRRSWCGAQLGGGVSHRQVAYPVIGGVREAVGGSWRGFLVR